MFDIAWTELLLVVLVAVIFLGPKELISVMGAIGKFVGKAQTAAHNVRMMMEYESTQQNTTNVSDAGNAPQTPQSEDIIDSSEPTAHQNPQNDVTNIQKRP